MSRRPTRSFTRSTCGSRTTTPTPRWKPARSSFELTTISGDLETLVLAETGAATQVYEGSIDSNTGPTFAVPGRRRPAHPQAGDGVTATHLDLNGSTQSSDSATAATAYLVFVDQDGRPVTSLLENSKAYLRLYDWFTSGSPSYRDYAVVQVYAGISGDQEWVSLLETAPDSHISKGRSNWGAPGLLRRHRLDLSHRGSAGRIRRPDGELSKL